MQSGSASHRTGLGMPRHIVPPPSRRDNGPGTWVEGPIVELATLSVFVQRDAVTIQMLLDALGEHCISRSAARLREAPEQQAAADFPRGVLDKRQAELLSLPLIARDVVQMLGIRADLLK
jgi:hypothetical protein